MVSVVVNLEFILYAFVSLVLHISFSILTVSQATFSLLFQTSFIVNFKYSLVLTHSCQSFCIIFSLLLYFSVARDVKVASYLGKFVIIQNKEFVDKRKKLQMPSLSVKFVILRTFIVKLSWIFCHYYYC